MDLDRSNMETLKRNAAGTYTANQYVYVYKDTVYYNNAEDKKIYSMKTDGTNHAEFVNGYGEMRVYGNKFFYFFVEKKDEYDRPLYDLMSIESESTTCKIEVSDANAFHRITSVHVSGGNFHVKDNTIYFHSGSHELYSVPLGSGGTSKTTVSSGKYDNYVFADNVIYFRWHAQGYSIAKGAYVVDFSPSLVGERKSNEEIYEQASINASSSFFVYVNRIRYGERDETKTRDLRFVSSDGLTEQVLVKDVRNKDIFDYPKLRSEVKIIGDWVYYTLQKTREVDDNTFEFEIHRINKDGTGGAKVQTIY